MVTTHMNYMTKVFAIDIHGAVSLDEHISSFMSATELHTFKTMAQLGMEVCFDPSSRYIAIGTSDSHVKVFDTVKGFQTHNFLGHRGVIVKLAFYPKVDSLKLISSSEDFTVRIWDLVLNTELHCLRGQEGRVSAFAFSDDLDTLLVATKHAQVIFYNVRDNFKQIGAIEAKEIKGLEEETGINALIYLENNDAP